VVGSIRTGIGELGRKIDIGFKGCERGPEVRDGGGYEVRMTY
jgi:hypothetical protein